MKATDVLMSEHQVIQQVLAVLEAIAGHAEADGILDREEARQTIDFFRTFADGCHHAKEEQHLFPLLESHGLPREHGPTGVMLHEHELGRNLLNQMTDALGEGMTARAFVAPAREYVSLMREHIWKENERLFRMAERLLGANEDDELLHAFQTVEHAVSGAETHQHYLDLANHLADRYGVTRVNAPVTCGCSLHQIGMADH